MTGGGSNFPPQVVVLGGGLGTRMEGLTGGRPKSLIPILGEPFVHHQLRLLASQGISEVVYVVGFRGDQIRAEVGDGRLFGVAVSYVDEGDHLHGTGGALRYAYGLGALDEAFGVLYGDSYLPVDLHPVWAAFQASGQPALMTVLRNDDRWDRSNAVFEDGRVTNYDKRAGGRDPQMRWIDFGFSLLRRDVVESIPEDAVLDLGDVFHELSERGDLAGFEVDTRFFEVGSPEGVASLEAHLRTRPGPVPASARRDARRLVSVLVPCFGDLPVLEKSVPRLLASAGVELEVILLNNDSRQSEGLRRLVASFDDARLRVVELDHAVGFAKALNAGIASSCGELVFFANSDLFVTESYLAELQHFFEAHPRAGGATGKIHRYDLDAERELPVLDTTGLVMGRDRGASDRGQNEDDMGLYEQEEQVFGCSGAALLARREALESVAVDGEHLDETFFMYKEDVDLSWRLRLAGWECWYVPRAVAYHARTSAEPMVGGLVDGIRSFHRNERAKPRHVRVHSLKNQWLMLVKNEDRANLVRDLPFIGAREALVLGYNAISAPRITFTAIREFRRALPAARRKRRAAKAMQSVSPAEIRRWFRHRTQSAAVVRGRRDDRVPTHSG